MIKQEFHYSIGRILLFAILCQASLASSEITNIDLYFWPTAVERSIENESYLYAWPQFKVLLQTKADSDHYIPAIIAKETAMELGRVFEPDADSPIRIFRNDVKQTWGLVIPGGHFLRKENDKLLDYMSEKFLHCLAHLNEQEIDVMNEIIRNPSSLLREGGGLMITETMNTIVAKMLKGLRDNACAADKAVIPEEIIKISKRYLNFLLVGRKMGDLTSDREILVFSSVFKEFLFSGHGLWVKAVLSKIKEFVTSRATQFPITPDLGFLQHDYTSFIDFILMNRNNPNLTKGHFLSFAKICGVNGLGDLFSRCPVTQLVNSRKITSLNLNLGPIKSVHFVKREGL